MEIHNKMRTQKQSMKNLIAEMILMEFNVVQCKETMQIIVIILKAQM